MIRNHQTNKRLAVASFSQQEVTPHASEDADAASKHCNGGLGSFFLGPIFFLCFFFRHGGPPPKTTQICSTARFLEGQLITAKLYRIPT